MNSKATATITITQHLPSRNYNQLDRDAFGSRERTENLFSRKLIIFLEKKEPNIKLKTSHRTRNSIENVGNEGGNQNKINNLQVTKDNTHSLTVPPTTTVKTSIEFSHFFFLFLLSETKRTDHRLRVVFLLKVICLGSQTRREMRKVATDLKCKPAIRGKSPIFREIFVRERKEEGFG